MTTLKHVLIQTCQKQDTGVALRYKQEGMWHEMSWGDVIGRVRQVSEILGYIKVRPGDRVAIYLDNCHQWPVIYLGIVSAGLTAVPVDAKLRTQEVAHILRDSEAVAVFASAKTYPVLREAEENTPALSTAILVDGEQLMPVQNRHVRYLDFDSVMAQMKAPSERDDCVFNTREPQPDDAASIIYTSGTTGRQKGAMLTHANFCSNAEAALQMIDDVSPEDNFLLVLPLHHAFAFIGNFMVPLFTGAQTSFVESLKTVGENTREVSPTVLIGVPLLIEKMYAKIMAGLKKKPLAYLLYRTGLKAPVVKKIQEKLGGKLRFVIVGGAPCSVEVLKGYRELGIPILEGYGLTETAPVLTLNPPDDPRPGTVGRALPNVEISIRDPNEQGIGEIVAKGPNVMKGYFKNPQATEEVFADGWFLTGDMGFIDDDGYVTITGRKKSLIVNREGKNIYPEEVESAILKNDFVLEAIVLGYTGDGETGERVGVIVVPDQEAIDALHPHRKQKMTDDELTDLMVKEVKKAIANLADYKRPRRIQVRTEEFEKTSTQKVKRYLYAITPQEV